jgi:hypothetical protein
MLAIVVVAVIALVVLLVVPFTDQTITETVNLQPDGPGWGDGWVRFNVSHSGTATVTWKISDPSATGNIYVANGTCDSVNSCYSIVHSSAECDSPGNTGNAANSDSCTFGVSPGVYTFYGLAGSNLAAGSSIQFTVTVSSPLL